MKNLFKLFAFIIILTLLPVSAPASAAVTVKPAEKKVLFIGGARGSAEGGSKSARRESVSYARLLGIRKKQAKKLNVTGITSDPKVIIADNELKAVSACAIGSATVTLTCREQDYTVPVKVKRNADKVIFGLDWEKAAGSFSAEVDKEYTVSLPKYEKGKKIDTDGRRLVCADDSVLITPVEGKKRVYTVKFTKAGEFTVTGEAFQSKKFPVATAKAEVKVKAENIGISAKQTGAKKITVSGNGFSKDTVFTVKRGNITVEIPDKPNIAKNGKSADITLASRLMAADYTISAQTGETVHGSAVVSAKEEKVEKIVILEDEDKTPVKTNASRDTIYVHYDVLNQFGESVRKNYNITWTSSFGNSSRTDNKNAGIISFTDSSASHALDYGTQIVITGVYSGSNNVVSASATLSVGLELCAGKVELVGVWNNSTRKLAKTLPASFQKDEYSIVFKMFDSDGYPLKYEHGYADSISFTSVDPLLFTTEASYSDTVMVDGEEYPAVKISGVGYKAKEGGTVQVRAISTKSGIMSEIEVKIKAAQILDSFTICQPADIVVKGETSTLDFEALDTEGKPITAFRDLCGMVTLVGDGLWIEENDDGTATLKYEPASNVNPSDKVDSPVMLMAIVTSSGKSSSITVNVKAKAYASAVSRVIENVPLFIVEGGSQKVLTSGDSGSRNYLKYYDQYSREIKYAGKDANGYVIIAKYPGNDLELTGGTVVSDPSIASDGAYTYVRYTADETMTINAIRNCTGTEEEETVEFFLYDVTEGKIVPGSEKKITWTVVDISRFVSFTVSDEDGEKKFASNADSTDWSGTATKSDTLKMKVQGVLSNGKKIPVLEEYIKYEASISELLNNAGFDTATNSSGCNISADKKKIFRNGYPVAFTMNFALSDQSRHNASAADSFLDYSKVNSDGTYSYRFATITMTAKIYCATSGAGITGAPIERDENRLQGTASGSVSVGVEPSVLKEFVKDSKKPVAVWSDKKKNKAVFKATNGVISTDTLRSLIEDAADKYEYDDAGNLTNITLGKPKGKDNYDRERSITAGSRTLTANGITKTGHDNVIIEISEYVEAKDGLKNDITGASHAINGNYGQDAYVTGAEIGDKFTVTYIYHDVKLTVSATVGSDTKAVISPADNKPDWR